MKILKAIAKPFVALWNWIKETAWIQPLLIVGCIFGIILSIPYISSGIQNLINQKESHLKYFETSYLSLEGSKQGQENSAANKFFDAFVDAQDAWAQGDKTKAQAALKNYSGENKFFLFFVQEDCSSCKNLKVGAQYLQNNWSSYIGLDGETYASYKFQAIEVDQTFDDDYYTEENRKPIDDLVASNSYLSFYRTAMSMVDKQNYYINLAQSNSTSASTLISNTTGLNETSKIQTPTCMIIDLSDDNKTGYIISTIFYSIPSSDSDDINVDCTKFLANAWMGKEDFENKLVNA